MRVLTYNARGCVGSDGKYDLGRVADLLSAQSADVVAVQQLHASTQAASQNQPQELARRMGMHVTFHAAMPGCPRYPDGPGSYGNALFTRTPALITKSVALPKGEGYSLSQEPRVAQAVRVGWDQPWIVNTHLGCDLTGYEQSAAMPVLRHFAESLPNGAVVCGDFNCVKARAAMREVDAWTDAWLSAKHRSGSGGYFDGCTMPARLPLWRIDYQFGVNLLQHAWKPLSASVISTKLGGDYPSENLPLLVEWVHENTPATSV
jgi:endonuclease/exonuclease/phosphatase family metal-dependent hydrolase